MAPTLCLVGLRMQTVNLLQITSTRGWVKERQFKSLVWSNDEHLNKEDNEVNLT